MIYAFIPEEVNGILHDILSSSQNPLKELCGRYTTASFVKCSRSIRSSQYFISYVFYSLTG